MRSNRPTGLLDVKIDEKIVLSALWTSVLFVFAYVDVFGFWRADIIKGALAGRVPGTGVAINQTFLVLATGYILVPSLMIVASLLVPAKVNRVVSIVVSLFYFASIVVMALGESWTYYLLGTVFELVLLLAIVRTAWTWRRSSGVAVPLARNTGNAAA